MQMIRKWGFALISMLTVFLSAGCGAADKARYLEKMPSMDELREFYDSHTKEEYDNRLREIKPLIDKTTDEEFRIIFETSIETWADTQAPITIDNVSVEVFRDDLMMNEYANKKMYENLFVRANIYYDPKQISGDEAEIVEQIYDGVMDALRETPYGAYKIYEMKIACYDSESNIGRYGESTRGFGNGYSELEEKIWVVEQPAQERNIQTVVHDFVEEFNDEVFRDDLYRFARHGNVTLRRFGIKLDSDELYMEIPIYLPPMDPDDGQDGRQNGDQDHKIFADSLAGKGQEIYDRIMAEEEAVTYLQDHAVHTVVIDFYTPWSREQNKVYAFHLEGQ